MASLGFAEWPGLVVEDVSEEGKSSPCDIEKIVAQAMKAACCFVARGWTRL